MDGSSESSIARGSIGDITEHAEGLKVNRHVHIFYSVSEIEQTTPQSAKYSLP